MFTIGLNGGIGSGKSSVRDFLKAKGAQVIDADIIGQEMYTTGSTAWQKIIHQFGEGILQPDRRIDRKKLGELVFADPEALEKLNSILHPLMYLEIKNNLKKMRTKGTPVAVLEAAILIEAGWGSLVDEVWLVVAPASEVEKRLAARSGLTPQQVKARLSSQMSDVERKQYANAIIENDGTIENLRAKLELLWKEKIEKRGPLIRDARN
ncbi:MAG: dephospho-CoA kinase [Dehalococcoidia bacterium]|nr:dephospho-CoA kinase [Dehalococcoidia bacterium]